MRLSSITVIILRLFGLYWFAAALLGFVGVLSGLAVMLEQFKELAEYGDDVGIRRMLLITPLLTPIGYLILGLIAWFASGKIAKRVVREVDSDVAMKDFGPANLYAVGLLVVGLYFFLTYLGGSLGWLHYLAANQAGDALMHGEGGLSIYEVISQIVPCAGGLYFALLSGRFGRRLARKSELGEQSVPPKSDRAGG